MKIKISLLLLSLSGVCLGSQAATPLSQSGIAVANSLIFAQSARISYLFSRKQEARQNETRFGLAAEGILSSFALATCASLLPGIQVPVALITVCGALPGLLLPKKIANHVWGMELPLCLGAGALVGGMCSTGFEPILDGAKRGAALVGSGFYAGIVIDKVRREN